MQSQEMEILQSSFALEKDGDNMLLSLASSFEDEGDVDEKDVI